MYLQLLITMAFNQPVKLFSMKLQASDLGELLSSNMSSIRNARSQIELRELDIRGSCVNMLVFYD